MPRFSALLLAVFLLNQAAVAQRPRFSVGLKAGVGLSGTTKKEFLENRPNLSVVTDQFRPRTTYAGGLRLNYRLLRRLHLTLDVEAQRLRDVRVRDRTFSTGSVRFEYTERYENRFNRLQAPLTLRFDVWLREKTALYLCGGVQLARLWGGHTEYVFSSNIPTAYGEADSYAIPLAIPANRHLRTEWQPVAGVGWQVNRHLAVELTAHLGRKLRYDLFDPGYMSILPPNDRSWANRDGVLSAVYTF